MNFSHKCHKLHWFNKVTNIYTKYKTIQLKGLLLYYFVTYLYFNDKCIGGLLFDNGSPASVSKHF